MAERTQYMIGAGVSCRDGLCGHLSWVVVDPVARSVTHLVVAPEHGQGPARLVPLALVDATTPELRLRCTAQELEQLEPAEETQFLPGSGGIGDCDPEETLSWPYYGLGVGGMGVVGTGLGAGPVSLPVTYETVPLGEVAVRRGEHVHATDGNIGRVQGLVIRAGDHHVTHVLLQEGHLWGRKQVAIPISAVTGVEDGIRLNITKREVEDLPAVDL